jgi:hypothetical protein
MQYHTCRAMAASSHAEIKNICVCSWRKLTVNFIHHITNSPINNFKHLTSSNWLSYLQLQHIFFLGLSRQVKKIVKQFIFVFQTWYYWMGITLEGFKQQETQYS